MIRALRAAGRTGAIEFDAANFCLNADDGKSKTFLHNAYTDYCHAPVLERKRVMAAYSNLGKAAHDTLNLAYNDAKGSLLPRVRERAYSGSIDLQQKLGVLGKLDVPRRLINERLTVEIVRDLPESIVSVGEK